MTQAELDALPDASGGFGIEDREIDGVMRRCAVYIPPPAGYGAFFTGPEDGQVIDATGVRWMTGWIDGVRYKRRMSYQPV